MRYLLIMIVAFFPLFVRFESFDYQTHVYVVGIMLMINEVISNMYDDDDGGY